MSCTLHKLHRPRNLTTEQHHIIPQAWQEFWVPPSEAQMGHLPSAHRLWDGRTVELCPTSHRNVHYWIVKMMKALAAKGSDDPLDAKLAIGPKLGREQAIAYSALTRFRASTGSLRALYTAGEWGQA